MKKKGSGAGVRDKGEIGQKELGRREEGKYWCMGKEGVDVRRGRDSDTCEETCEGRVLFEKRRDEMSETYSGGQLYILKFNFFNFGGITKFVQMASQCVVQFSFEIPLNRNKSRQIETRGNK